MPNDYKVARAARPTSRIVIKGIDEPAKNFASNIPKSQQLSSDIEDRRNDTFDRAAGWLQHKVNPVKMQ